MVGRHAQGLSTIHNILAKAQGQRGDALLGRLVAYGVIVETAKHARYVGVIVIAIALAHHLLKDDGHLLLIDDIACGSHVCFRVAIVHRGVDTLDGGGQHVEHLVLILQVGNHIGAVNTGERLVMTVLKERAGTDGDRTLRGFEEGKEVVDVTVGQLSTEEVLQDDIVGGVAQGDLVEVVLLHELVEDIGTEHHCLGYAHAGPGVLIELGMGLHHIVEESQATALAAKRTVANAGEMGILVKLTTVEHGHHTNILHVTILHDGVEDDLPMGINILQLVPSDVFQEVGHGEDGASREPTTHVVA